ncbi:MAG: prolipoprotein diacylglyceryl transferase [Candidatus Woesearchaeota archaeon]
MFVHNFDPVLVSFGPVSIHWYGLVYVLGFIGLYFGMRRLAGLTQEEADSLVLYAMLGLVLGARAFFFLFYRPDLFSLGEFFAVWRGGMSFHGGFVGLVIALYYWCKRYKYSFWRLADVGALLAGFFLFLGRLANFVNAEIVGVVSDASWCVLFPGYEECRHPVQLYAAIKNLVIGGCMVLLYRSRKFSEGFVFWCFTLLYGVLRFAVNFFRDDPVILFSWLKMGHLLSLGLVVVAVVVLTRSYWVDVAALFKKKHS